MDTRILSRLNSPVAIRDEYALLIALLGTAAVLATDIMAGSIPLNLFYIFPLAFAGLYARKIVIVMVAAAFSLMAQLYVLSYYDTSLTVFVADAIMIAMACGMAIAAARAIRLSHLRAEIAASNAKLVAALESMTDAVFISDTTGDFVDFNEAFATYHRFRNKAECLKRVSEYPHILEVTKLDGEPLPLNQWAVPRALRGERASNADYMLRLKSTGETWIGSYNFGPIRDDNGVIIGSVITARDVTKERMAEQQLRQAYELLTMAEKSAAVGSWTWDIVTDKVIWSPELYRLFGLNAQIDKASFQVWRLALHPDDVDEAQRSVNKSVEEHIPLASTYRVKWPDGEIRWIDVVGNATYDEHGKPLRMPGICIDVTNRKAAEDKLKETESDFKAFFENVSIGAALIDTSGRFVSVNPQFAQICGCSQEQLLGGMTPLDICDPNEVSKVREAIARVFHGEQDIYRDEHSFKRQDGREYRLSVSAAPVRDEDGAISKLAGVITDVTERHEAEQQLRQSEGSLRALNLSLEAKVESRTASLVEANRQLDRLARMDALTDIPNRLSANERLRQEYMFMKRMKQPYSVLMIDIDHFKSVNDAYGHEAGDRVLHEIAQRLRKELRESDFIARFGGEEFIAMLPATSIEGGIVVADKLRQSIEKMDLPGVGRVTISIGVSVASPDNASEDEAIKMADDGLYEAKSAGRNRVVGVPSSDASNGDKVPVSA